MELENKSIIITGASSGIGAAAATLFAAEGANVILGARRPRNLRLLRPKSVKPAARPFSWRATSRTKVMPRHWSTSP